MLTDDPLLETGQVEVVRAGGDDGLRMIHVEVTDAADITMLGELALGSCGQTGAELPDTVSSVEVERNAQTNISNYIDQEEDEKANDD